jgi:membrane complex biogenesis BtpA family protein
MRLRYYLLNWIEKTTKTRKPIIGMVHLPPLPGNPKCTMNPEEIVDKAIQDAQTLVENGVPAVLVENYHDHPYPKYKPRTEVVGIMSITAERIARELGVPVGINVLRNCGVSALSIAHVSGASFIRVNALSQTIVTDQGIIEPIAYPLALKRRLLGTHVKVMADINVKHSRPLRDRPLETVARETVERGDADAIIITGEATGYPADPQEVYRVKKVLSKTPVVVGSGITNDNIERFIKNADAFIVGTYFKGENGELDPEKIRKLVNTHKELIKTI